jgi:hypothetical protein
VSDRDVHLLSTSGRFRRNANAQIAARICPSVSPVKPITVSLHWRVTSVARGMLGLLLLAEIARNTSHGRHEP